MREYLGWSEILAKEDELNLTTCQRNQATERRAKAGDTTDARLLGAYQWALVPTRQPIEIQPTKVERASRRLGNDGALTVQHAAPAIRHQLNTTAGKLWGGRPRDRGRALCDCTPTTRTCHGCVTVQCSTPASRGRSCRGEQEGFELADGYDDARGKYRALVLPTDGVTVAVTDATLIVRPDLATSGPSRRRNAPTLKQSGFEER